MTETEMTEITWSDGISSRGRRGALLLIRGDRIVRFQGDSIPGMCAVLTGKYTKNGKWSETTYRIQLAAGARHVALRQDFGDGTWTTGLLRNNNRTWANAAAALGVPVDVAAQYLRAEWPGVATALDDAEAAIAALK